MQDLSALPLGRAAVVWCVIAMLAIVNGMARDNVIAPLTGSGIALPLSGITLSAIVLIITYFSLGYLGVNRAAVCLLIGLQWVVMTIAFEFLFGHFVAGKSWSALVQTFNMARGDLFVLVLLTSLLAPCTMARLRGMIEL